MLFPTIEYSVLFLLAFALAWATTKHSLAHRIILIGLSWCFYAWSSLTHLPLLLALSVSASWIARRIQGSADDQQRTRWLFWGCAAPLALLAVFKYAAFAVGNLSDLLHLLGIDAAIEGPDIALPIGVSFFVFHAISLVVDVHRGNVRVPVRWLDGALYLSFFPQLVAGPVVRASDFLPQLTQPPSRAQIHRDRAILLILAGLFKKVVLASHLGILVSDPVFDAPAEFGGARVLVAIYAYAGQIYCDFSGYTDMAIGSALLLGYRFKDNFDAPYSGNSIQDFWRRWHISLSSFLRDYLFIPLGGSRHGEWQTRRNLLITMLLGGLWHGAGWNFILWGCLHGTALVIHRAWSQSPIGWVQQFRQLTAWPILAWLLTFHTVCLGWVFFRAANFDQAVQLLQALLRPGSGVPWQAWLLVAIGVLSQSLPWHRWTPQMQRWMARLPSPVVGAGTAVAVLSIDALGPIGVPPFIYFQF